MRIWTRRFSVAWNGSATATPVLSESAAAGLPSISPIRTRPVSGPRGVEGGQVADRGGVLLRWRGG